MGNIVNVNPPGLSPPHVTELTATLMWLVLRVQYVHNYNLSAVMF